MRRQILSGERSPLVFANKRDSAANSNAIRSIAEKAVANHIRWRKECLNLNAAESMISEKANALLSSDLGRRAVNGLPRKRYATGGKYIDVIEDIVSKFLRELYNAKYPEWRPMSGSVANGILVHAMSTVGDSILATPKPLGHHTWREEGYAGFRGLKVHDLPFNWETLDIEYDKIATTLQGKKFSLVVYGSHFVVFPPDFDRLTDELGEVPLWYDGAHVMGLIAGGTFPNPLEHGAHALTGSTQKTLSGPVGGVILTNDESLNEKLCKCVDADLATPDYGRIAALAVTLAEWHNNGRAFAKSIVENAKSLAANLVEEGISVLFENRGFTSTHQIGIVAPSRMTAISAALKLEASNIITLPFSMPDGKEGERQILRVGTSEITRQGFCPADMGDVARAIALGFKAPERAAKIVSSLTSEKKTLLYA